MRQIGSFFQSLLPFIIFMAINVIVNIVLMVVYCIKAVSSGDLDVDIITYMTEVLPTDQQFLQMTCLVFGIIICLGFIAWYRKAFVRPLRSKPRKYWSRISLQVILSLIFLAFGLQYISLLLTNGIGTLFPDFLETYNNNMADMGYYNLSPMLLGYTLFLAPLGEELTFRGLTMRFARKSMPFWAANILQAFLFGVVHLNVIQGIYAFCLGLFFGWVCKEGHSIKYSIILHIIFNTLGTLFTDFFDVTTALNATAFYCIGIGLTIFALITFHWEFSYKNKRQRKQYEKEVIEE